MSFLSDYGSLISIILFCVTDVIVWFRTRKTKSDKIDQQALKEFANSLHEFVELLKGGAKKE